MPFTFKLNQEPREFQRVFFFFFFLNYAVFSLFPLSYETMLTKNKFVCFFLKLLERNSCSSFLCRRPSYRFGTFDGQEECCSEVGFLVLFGLSLSILCVSLSKQESAMSCFYCFTTSLFKLEKSKYWSKTLVCCAAGVRQKKRRHMSKTFSL